MADTVRTLSELNILLRDNTVQEISPQDIRDILMSLNVHAEMGLASWTDSVDTSWTIIPLDTAGVFSRNLTINTVNNRIEAVPCDMKIMATVEIQTSDPPGGEDFDFAVFKTGVQDNISRRSFTAGGHYSWSVGIQAATDDYFQLAIRAASSTSITLTRALLRINRVGVE